MNLGNPKDLTVVLIRGNGSPRSFRIHVPSMQRFLVAISVAFTASLVALLVASLLLVFTKTKRNAPSMNPPPSAVAPAPTIPAETQPTATPPPVAKTEEAKPSEKAWTGWFSKTDLIPGSAQQGNEKEKELAGLREDIAKLSAQLEERKKNPSGNVTVGAMQFLGPNSTLMAEQDVLMKVKNPRIRYDENSKELNLDFELHNTDPAQNQVRGYIVVLAITKEIIASYPSAVFSPNDNIVVDFTKGETFGVSRFREAHATFSNFLSKKPSFRILLFRNDGKLLVSQHVENR